ncbi:DUF1553 domain-containing protein [Novipirellula rosea]|uniref:DUF1549 domain-containing protein n=1 Tax=Novipirellula rosea TaxID=1031540 RepID=A0ABP8NEM9_9BACT
MATASTSMSRRIILSAGVVFQFAFFSLAAWSQEPGSVDFFENRIRPVLVEHCYECHSAESDDLGGSLLLDSSGGMTNGGDSGPAIVQGDPRASLLISAIRYESTEMPPQGQLPAKVIADFEQWISAGAIDPRDQPPAIAKTKPAINIESGKQFWAFRPIDAPAIPLASPPSETSATSASSERPRSCGSPIDCFLDEKLANAKIDASELAAPDVRLRRLCFDLTGLPPSIDLQQAWSEDPSPQHWIQIVDRLLSSIEFAEHWARHWMDLARYADSNGADFNATHHDAWRYRDYLVRSFADGRSIDEMIQQQIAGDLLPSSSDSQRWDNLVATTFLMLGTKMLSERDKDKLEMDVVDEQIDTVGRAFLGLTLGCARCHDHKFDPVPMRDYYALAGIFRSTQTLNGESQQYVSTWNKTPLPTSDKRKKALADHKQQQKSLEDSLKQLGKELAALKERITHRGIVIDDEEGKKSGQWKASTLFHTFVSKGYVHDNNGDKGKLSIQFSVRLPESGRYEIRLAGSPGSNRASQVPITIKDASGDHDLFVNQRTAAIDEIWNSLGEFQFNADQDAIVTIRNTNTDGYVIVDAIQFLQMDAASESADKAKTDPRISQAVEQKSKEREHVQAKIAELKKNPPEPLPLAMAPRDRSSDMIADCPIHIRGETANLGDRVPRGFLQVCSGGSATIASPRGSGRLELADWLTDPDNPLVARVFVNRVWMHLMGEGIVRTVDNFGVQGERPSHPELLDFLASDFLRGGWQVKPLIRSIVTTQAYQRSSALDSISNQIDPENRLLWRMHRRRLPAEAIRDTMLVAANQLDRTPRFEPMKGMGVLVSNNNSDSNSEIGSISQSCRTLYMPVVRGYVPALVTALDAADPDLLVGKRPTTNVPGQALVLINSPEIKQWSEATAKRICSDHSDFSLRIEAAYRCCFQRMPTAEDRELATDFFAGQQNSTLRWHAFIAAMFAATEFRLLD